MSGDLLGNIFSGAGLVFFGGLIGGAVGVLLWARWRGWLGWELLDSAAAPIAIGYAVGRIGCQLSGDGDYGEPSDLPWAMAYPEGTVPTTDEVHPTPIYETLTMGLVTLLLWHLRDRLAPGVLFGLYLILAGHRALPGGAHPPQRRRRRRASPCPSCSASRCWRAARRWWLARVRAAAARDRPRPGARAAPPRRRPRAHSTSATEAPAAVPASADSWMPATPAAAATAAPASIAAPGERTWRRTATGGATSTASTSSAPRPWTAIAIAAAISAEQRQPHEARGAGRARRAPAGSNEVAASGRRSAGQGRSRRPRSRSGRGGEVAVGDPERVAEQQLLQALGRVRRERQQRPEPDQAGDRHGRAGVGPDARVARRQGDQRRRPPARRRRRRAAAARRPAPASTSPGSSPCESDSAA